MSHQRRIDRVVTVASLAPGFVGPGHLAAQVVSPEDFGRNDPFIMLADDHLDIGERPVGGPHPHAGFETVTLILDGAIYDRDEGGPIAAGEVQWMTAGRGIIHGEHTMTKGKVRLLQLWLTLPKDQRWTTPGFQDIHAGTVPVRREPGVEIRIYSGGSGKLQSATRNHVPVTIVEIAMDAHAAVDQEIPIAYNGFLYVIRGSVRVGEDAALLQTGQVGWLDRPEGEDTSGMSGLIEYQSHQASERDLPAATTERPVVIRKRHSTSVVRMAAGEPGARLVVYAGQPQGNAIVSHGPFIGDSRDDIVRLYMEYRAGRFERMSNLARKNRVA